MNKKSEHVYTNTIGLHIPLKLTLNVSSSLLDEILVVARRVPPFLRHPDMEILRYYVHNERKTALRSLLTFTMEEDWTPIEREHRQNVHLLHDVIMRGKMRLVDWRDKPGPSDRFIADTELIAALHFMDNEPMETIEADIERNSMYVFLARNGRRVFKCKLFERLDDALRVDELW